MTRPITRAGGRPEDLRIALPSGLSLAQKQALQEASLSRDELTTSSAIHGFCHGLLCSYAVEVDVDPGAQVLDATQADFAFRNVFDQWLARRLGTEGVPDDPIALMARWDPEEAVEILWDLGKFRRRFRTACAVNSDLEISADREFVESVREFRRWFNSVSGPATAEQELIELEILARFYEGKFTSQKSICASGRLPNGGDLLAHTEHCAQISGIGVRRR